MRRYVGETVQSWEKNKLLIVSGSCGTVTLYQYQDGTTLVVTSTSHGCK